MSKIATGLLAKILGYTFAGYGLVCDAHFLKALADQARYQLKRFFAIPQPEKDEIGGEAMAY